MNAKRILVALTIALVVSGGCTWLLARKLLVPAVAPPAPRLTYVAPSRDMEAGEVLKADTLEMVGWHGSEPIQGAFSETNSLISRELLFPLAKGQPILGRDLSAPGAGIGLASKIPDGMRAVALRSDEIVGVAGFLVPGSHLDVLATYHSNASPEPVTATVVQNAIVIAAGQQIEPDPAGKPAAVNVVTLLLTPLESQRAVLASNQGAIHFVLRNGGDAVRTHENPVLLSELAGDKPIVMSRPVPHPAVAKAAPPAPKHREIEIVLGGGSSVDPESVPKPYAGGRP